MTKLFSLFILLSFVLPVSGQKKLDSDKARKEKAYHLTGSVREQGGPCQLELAEIEKTLWAEYKDNKDFVLLVIGREHTDEQLKAYNERKKFTFPLYPDPKREVFSLFAEKSIPRAYLFNKEGEAVYTSIGYEKEEFGYLMNAIAEALK